MDLFRYQQQRIQTKAQSTVLILSLTAILGLMGWILGGLAMAAITITVTLVLFFINPVISPYLIFKMYRGEKLPYYNAPRLYELLRVLAQRAGLNYIPTLYYIPSQMMNAFATGRSDRAVIGVTAGLLNQLPGRAVAAVLAHEISHIKNKDMRTLGFTSMVLQATHLLSLIGQFLLLINLPLILMEQATVNWGLIFLLILAPHISLGLYLALSRTREYAADLGAAGIIGDPSLLAHALLKIDSYHKRLKSWRSFFPYSRESNSGTMNTHPPTRERVRRLMNLERKALRYEAPSGLTINHHTPIF